MTSSGRSSPSAAARIRASAASVPGSPARLYSPADRGSCLERSSRLPCVSFSIRHRHPPRGAHDQQARPVLAGCQVHAGVWAHLPFRHPGTRQASARPAPRRQAAGAQHGDLHLRLPRLPAGRLRPDARAREEAAGGPPGRLLVRTERRPRRDGDLRQPDGRPLPAAEVRRRARDVVRQGAGRGPDGRRLQARQLRWRRKERRGACVGRRRPRLQVLDAPEPLGGRPLRRADADDLPGQCPGHPRPGAARLHALARLRALGRRQDRHERRG